MLIGPEQAKRGSIWPSLIFEVIWGFTSHWTSSFSCNNLFYSHFKGGHWAYWFGWTRENIQNEHCFWFLILNSSISFSPHLNKQALSKLPTTSKTCIKSTEPLAGDVEDLGLPVLDQGSSGVGVGSGRASTAGLTPPSPAHYLLHTWLVQIQTRSFLQQVSIHCFGVLGQHISNILFICCPLPL